VASIDQRRFRDALGCYPTGVAIITAPDGRGGHVGITANSFASLSLDPPLVLWSLDKKAYSREAFHTAGYFGINVLSAEQVELSRHFSRRHLDKFASIEVEMGEGGVALIDNCVARFECRTHQTYEGGDHIIFIGEVMAFDYDTTRSPLAFTGGSYAQTAPHIHDPDAQSQASTVDG
jgi:3-hydroxy-9,10-secoandrosta-1,3,5(10)-triene-9,17-dione monooxygenase reductase component